MTVLAPAPGSNADVLALGAAAQVSPGDWDRLARRGFHAHAWCTAAERCGWVPRHVAVRDSGGLRAIFPAYLTGDDVAHDLHDRWLGPLRTAAERAGLALRPVLSVQSPFAQTSEPMAAPDLLSEPVLHDVFAALESEAEAAHARAVCWPWVGDHREDLIRVARERGYAVVYAGSAAVLPVEWGSFDDYLASRSKQVRRTVRADLRALEAAGLTFVWTHDFRREAAEMDRLYRDAFRRRNGRLPPTPADLFVRLGATPHPAVQAQLTRDGERLVGTSLNVHANGVLDGTFAAFASESTAGPVYYNDLCYAPVRLACTLGYSRIELGASALYAKVLRGAVLRPRVSLVRGTTRAVHEVLRRLGALTARRVEAKERLALGPLWERA